MSAARTRTADLLLLLNDLWNLGLLAVRALQPVMVLALLGLLAWALMSSQPWPFSVKAESEHVSILLAQDLETHWRIDGSLLCLRAAIEVPALSVLEGASPCPGRRWRAYDLRGLDEVTLRLPAADAAATGYAAHFDTQNDGSLAVLVSAEGSDAVPLALLSGDAASLTGIGQDAILHFPSPAPGEAPRRVLLPFTGAGSIGKDVSWREPTLLRQGTVSLYTRSDEAAGGRDLVASTELLPGDRVDLGPRARPGSAISKGFIHFDLLPELAAPATMTIVAFGEAEAVRIVRFGEQGYSFSPGILARLTRHSAVSTWAVLILSLLGFMALYKDGSELGRGDYFERRRVLRDRWREFRRPEPPPSPSPAED